MAMAQTSSVQQLKQAETEIAVLQVQYGNINEKVDALKTDLKDFRNEIKTQIQETHDLIKGFQDENNAQHDEVNKKISALEKWRWMLMGAGVLAGALGFDTIQKLFGM
jgi:septal ring factor EnvC (AmiA/AmiB activator)